MEVAKAPSWEFLLDSASTTPYVSAPSSPNPFGDPFDYYYHYSSAPTSPSRASAIYSHLATVFDEWEKTGSPSPRSGSEFDFSVAFSGQGQTSRPSLELTAADELFEKGKIRALKPPLHPESPREQGSSVKSMTGRGRERASATSSSVSVSESRSRRGSRSLSPIRGGEAVFHKTAMSSPSPSTTTPTATSSLKSGGSRKWRLKDLLLFRSASEGRATGRGNKDLLRKYTILSPSSLFSPFSSKKKSGEDKSGSFRSNDSSGGSVKKGGGPQASAHEMHYTANRAAAEEQKKKTPLPYQRNTLFACLHFNPAVRSIARGFNSNSFNRST